MTIYFQEKLYSCRGKLKYRSTITIVIFMIDTIIITIITSSQIPKRDFFDENVPVMTFGV